MAGVFNNSYVTLELTVYDQTFYNATIFRVLNVHVKDF